jgi:short-subunit dehydrogenase
MPTSTRKPVVLITGASTGLGLALARHLIANERYHLILTAREASLPRFKEAGITESDTIWIRPLDVTIPEQRSRVVAEADGRLGGVDILVNNAGIAYRSVLEHVDEADWLEQMQVNFRGPSELARLVLPAMRARRSGRIISVSSVSGMMAMPTMALYSASKFALEGAFEALWYEVRPWNIHVTLVQPGFVRSESFRNTRLTAQAINGKRDPQDAYHAHYAHMEGFIAHWMQRALSSPDHVARVIARIMKRPHPPLRACATPDAWIFALLRRLLPRELYHRFLYACLPRVREWGPNAILRTGSDAASSTLNAPVEAATSSTPGRR